jgi:pimeloyl-ACP methyl ester carboxylesterase
MPRVQVNDIAMNYEIHGQGFPLLLIAGMGADHTAWDENLVHDLAGRFQTIIFDNRGARHTDCPKGAFSIKQFAADAAGLLDALGITQAHVFGHSMGGLIAQQVAIDFPQKVTKLVLCSTTAGPSKAISPPDHVTQGIMDRAHGKLTDEQIVDLKVDHSFTKEFQQAHPDYIKKFRQKAATYLMPPEPYLRQVQAAWGYNSVRFLKKLKVPTFIMQGKKDGLVPWENAEILAQLIPGAKIAYCPESAHTLYTAEPEAFMKTLLDFLG